VPSALYSYYHVCTVAVMYLSPAIASVLAATVLRRVAGAELGVCAALTNGLGGSSAPVSSGSAESAVASSSVASLATLTSLLGSEAEASRVAEVLAGMTLPAPVRHTAVAFPLWWMCVSWTCLSAAGLVKFWEKSDLVDISKKEETFVRSVVRPVVGG
jgi:hypothetical protein